MMQKFCLAFFFIFRTSHEHNFFLTDGIAGLSSPCGRHLAIMPHPERCILSWQWPYKGTSTSWPSVVAPWSKMFQNAFDWCLTTK